MQVMLYLEMSYLQTYFGSIQIWKQDVAKILSPYLGRTEISLNFYFLITSSDLVIVFTTSNFSLV